MAYVTLVTTDIDAKSPLSDDIMTQIKTNQDHLKSAISDGASASQTLTISSVVLAAAGTALTVNNNMLVSGNFTVSGVITAATFFSTEELLWQAGFGGF